MTDQHVGKWKDGGRQMFETAAALKFPALGKKIITSPPYRQIIQQNERMLHSMHWEVSSHPSLCWRIETGCYLSHIPCDESDNFPGVIPGVSPQAVLHAEEEGSGDVGDRQPLRPPHRMELGCPHPQGQAPQEPAV